MAFSFDEFFDPLIRDQAAEFADDVPPILRGAYGRLTEAVVNWSIDDAVKALVERIMDAYAKTDGSQPLAGFALSQMTAEDEAKVDPLFFVVLLSYAVQFIEYLRNRRTNVALAASAAPSNIVEGRVVSALLLAPDWTITFGEGLKLP